MVARPTGIKGLSFGMGVDEVKAALGANVPWEDPQKPHVVGVNELDLLIDPQRGAHGLVIPGVSTKISTTVVVGDAECRLDFSDPSGERPSEKPAKLVGIFCEVARATAIGVPDPFEQIASKLIERHGAPTRRRTEEVMNMLNVRGRDVDTRLEWRSRSAFLVLERVVLAVGLHSSSVMLGNATPAHARILREAKADAETSRADVERAAARAEAARKAAERAAFEKGQKKLDSDLSGLAEKPPE